MKREFLEKLGLSKAAIDAVMAEHGKGLEEAHRRYAEAEEALTALCQTSESLTAERDRLKEALAQQTKEAENLRHKFILSLVAEACPSSGMAKEALYSRLSEEARRGSDLRGVLAALRETDPDAFGKPENAFPYFSVLSEAVVEEFPPLSSALKRR